MSNLSIALILSAVDRMSGPSKAAMAATRSGINDVTRAQAEADRASSGQAMVSAWRARRQAVADAGAAAAATQAQLTQLAREGGKGSAEWTKLVRAAQNAKTAEQQQAVALANLRKEMQAAGIDTTRLAEAQLWLGRDAERAQAQLAAASAKAQVTQARQAAAQSRRAEMQANGAELQGMVAQAAAMAATGGPVGLSVRSAMGFQDSFADLNKVANFDPTQAQAMSAALLEMQTRIPMAATGLADIMTAAKMSNVANPDLIRFTETAAKMGVAFDLSGKEAGSIMAAWQSGMKLTTDQTFALADAVNHLSNNGMNASAAGIAEVIQRQGAVAQTAGLAAQETAALAAAFLSAGAGPEIAATGLKNFLGALTDGTKATTQQREAWDFLGFDPEQLSVDMQRDAQGTITKVMERLTAAYNDPSVRDKVPALTSVLFGEESKGAIMPLLTNLDMVRRGFSLVGDQSQYAGSMQQEYDQRSKTASNSLALMRGAANSLAVAMGTQLLPAVSAVSGAVTWLLSSAADFATAFPVMTQVVMYGLTAFTAITAAVMAARIAKILYKQTVLNVKIAWDILTGAGTRAVAVFNFVRTAVMLTAGAMRAMAIAAMATPIILVIAGIAAAATLIYLYWGPISGFFAGVWDAIKGPALVAWSYLKELLAWTPLGVIVENWGPISNFFSGLWDGITAKAAAAWNWIKDTVLGPLIALKNTLGGAWNAVFGGGTDAAANSASAQAAVQAQAAQNATIPMPPRLVANDNPAGSANDNSVSVRPVAAAVGGTTYSFQVSVTLQGVGMNEVEGMVRKSVESGIRQSMANARADSRAVNYDQPE